MISLAFPHSGLELGVDHVLCITDETEPGLNTSHTSFEKTIGNYSRIKYRAVNTRCQGLAYFLLWKLVPAISRFPPRGDAVTILPQSKGLAKPLLWPRIFRRIFVCEQNGFLTTRGLYL